MATVCAPNVYCIAIIVLWDWFMLWLNGKIYDKLNDYKFLHIKCSCSCSEKRKITKRHVLLNWMRAGRNLPRVDINTRCKKMLSCTKSCEIAYVDVICHFISNLKYQKCSWNVLNCKTMNAKILVVKIRLFLTKEYGI